MTGELRVLFVDDDSQCRDAFVRSLANRGIAVDVAGDGAEAVLKAAGRPYDVIAVDVHMPGMDGLSVIERLRSKLPETPFIVVSGVADVGLKDSAAMEAVVSIVTKPWEPAELAEAITRAARRAAGGGTAPSILLVEDSLSDAKLIHATARRAWGAANRMTHVERVSDALRRLEGGSFDVVVTDLSLPDARGLDALCRLKRAHPDLPIVILSGSRCERTAAQAVRLGAQEYLLKERLDATLFRCAVRMAIERKRAENELVRAAHYDRLTGLANRRLFYDRLRPVISRCRRDQSRVAVLFIDLDGFKGINDRFGHDAGDFVLQTVARRIVGAVREYDLAARLGGDEFAVLLEGIQDAGAAFDISHRIRMSVAEPIEHGDQSLKVSASIGVGIFPDEAETTTDLMRHADQQMYGDKESRSEGHFPIDGFESSRPPAQAEPRGDHTS